MKVSPLIFILVFFLGYSHQKKPPYSFWLTKTMEFYRVNNDSALFYSKKMQSHAESSCEYINGLMYEANIIYFKRDCKASKIRCLKVLKEINEKSQSSNKKCLIELKTHVLGRLAYVEKCLGDYSKALEYIETNKKFCEANDIYIRENELALQYQTALVHIELGRYEKAILLLKKSANHFSVNLDKLALPSIYMSLGDIYLKSFKEYPKKNSILDSAKVYYKKHYDIAIKIKKQEAFTQQLYEIKKGNIAILEKKYENALLHFQKAKSIKLTEEKHFTSQEIDLFVAEAYNGLQIADSSVAYAKKFLDKHTLHPKNNDSKLKGYTILADAYNKNKQFKEAYRYSSLALLEIKKLDTSKIRGIEKLNLLRLEKIKKSNEAVLNTKNNQWIWHKVFFMAGLMILLLLIRFYLLKLKTKRKHKDSSSKKEKNSNTVQEVIIREDIIEKILLGLTKLEQNKAYLNPDFNLNFIAKILGSNTSYVSKIINSHRGNTFKEYTNNLRIQYIIKELQQNPKLRRHSLDALAKDIGYSNASSFSKIFKKTVGISPSYYIKELEKNK